MSRKRHHTTPNVLHHYCGRTLAYCQVHKHYICPDCDADKVYIDKTACCLAVINRYRSSFNLISQELEQFQVFKNNFLYLKDELEQFYSNYQNLVDYLWEEYEMIVEDDFFGIDENVHLIFSILKEFKNEKKVLTYNKEPIKKKFTIVKIKEVRVEF